MCSVDEGNVFSFQANVFSFWPEVFTFRPNVFTFERQVFSIRRCASSCTLPSAGSGPVSGDAGMTGMCPPCRADVSSFWPNASTSRPNVSSFGGNVSTLAGHVSTFGRRALHGPCSAAGPGQGLRRAAGRRAAGGAGCRGRGWWLDGWMVLPAIGGPRLRAAWATCRYEGARKRPVRDASQRKIGMGTRGGSTRPFGNFGPARHERGGRRRRGHPQGAPLHGEGAAVWVVEAREDHGVDVATRRKDRRNSERATNG